MATRAVVERGLRAAGFLVVLAYGFFALGYPSGYELTRVGTHLRLLAVGFLGALLVRSFWSLAFLPFALIVGTVAAGVQANLIRNLTQGAAAFTLIELWTFWAMAGGALAGTVLMRLTGRIGGRGRASGTPVPVTGQPMPPTEAVAGEDSRMPQR